MAVRRVRKVVISVLVTVLSLAVIVVGGPSAIAWGLSHSNIYGTEDVPARDVTLVMGAAMWGSGPSPYLQGRLDIAANLYRTGKTKVIIVSGTRDGGYNEPDGMRTALEAEGVPANRIVPDYQGFDTYSSCLRARDAFGVDSLIVVSQSYHLPRSIASCRLLGVDAVGVGDDSQAHDSRWYKYQVREVGGKMKLLYDVVTNRKVDVTPSDAVQVALKSS